MSTARSAPGACRGDQGAGRRGEGTLRPPLAPGCRWPAPPHGQDQGEGPGHVPRRVGGGDHVGLPVDQGAGVLGVHAGDGRDAPLRRPAGRCGRRRSRSGRRRRPGRPPPGVRADGVQPGLDGGLRGFRGPLVEEVVAAHQRGDDLAVALRQGLEESSRPHRALPDLRGVVSLLLGPDAGEELVQVMADPQHLRPTFLSCRDDVRSHSDPSSCRGRCPEPLRPIFPSGRCPEPLRPIFLSGRRPIPRSGPGL